MISTKMENKTIVLPLRQANKPESSWNAFYVVNWEIRC